MRAMKDSGVEWIGEIPQEWSLIRTKYIASITNGSDPKTEGNVPVYGSGDGSFKSCGEYKDGPAVLLGRKGATLHIPHYVSGKYWNVDTAFDVKMVSDRFDLKYYYALSTCFDYKYYTSTTTLPSMTQTNYGNMYLPFPSRAEQSRIIAFIETRCAEIDALIAAKEKTNALLKEHRQSIIYEAVTKGLDPTAPMKDSGVDWIGEIPEEWSVRRLKVLAELRTGSTPTTGKQEYFEGDINWFTPGDFSDNLYLTQSERTLSQIAANDGVVSLFDSDSILLIAIGATVGKVGLLKVPAYSNQQITAITLNEKKRAEYYAYWLQAAAPSIQATANYTTLPIINNAHLAETLCPFVEDEKIQMEIATYLKEQCDCIDKLVDKNKDTIRKLKEYRQSLIYEAVTGKIEV